MFDHAAPQPSRSVSRPKPLTSLHSNSRNAVERARDVVRGTAHGTSDVLGGAARALLTPAGMAGAAVEVAWAGTHLALYPFGLFGGPGSYQGHGYNVQELPPMQRGLVIGDVEAAGTPIHGFLAGAPGRIRLESWSASFGSKLFRAWNSRLAPWVSPARA